MTRGTEVSVEILYCMDAGFWSLEFEVSVEFGVWSLEFRTLPPSLARRVSPASCLPSSTA